MGFGVGEGWGRRVVGGLGFGARVGLLSPREQLATAGDDGGDRATEEPHSDGQQKLGDCGLLRLALAMAREHATDSDASP